MKLYIVATPIGNLKDITLRAIEILKEVDFVLCEDTRRTIKLLNHYQIKKSLISYHQHSKEMKINKIIELLEKNNNLALVSDAGTPGISDPGGKLIEKILEKLKDKIEIIPIPGVSALTSLASVSGISMDKFVFMGFPPSKKGRDKYFKKIISFEFPVIFYESKYKILKSLEELKELDFNLKIIVGNDLTKMFEKIYRGKIEEVIEEIKKDIPKGEYVVLIRKD